MYLTVDSFSSVFLRALWHPGKSLNISEYFFFLRCNLNFEFCDISWGQIGEITNIKYCIIIGCRFKRETLQTCFPGENIYAYAYTCILFPYHALLAILGTFLR